MRVLILSTHPTVTKWKTLKNKLAFFDRIYNSGKNANFAPTELKTIQAIPRVVNGKIDHDWLYKLQKPYFSQGYDIIKFHGSMAQKKAWGIKDALRGVNPNSKREQEDLYFFADENTKRNGLNQFEQTGGHEGGHGYYDHSGETDITHVWHDANPDISGLFKTFDWSKYQPGRIKLRKRVADLQNLLASLKKKTKLITDFSVTQKYGVKNILRYKMTGHHIGTDFAMPVGTPLVLPQQCEVTRIGLLPSSLGHWCEVFYKGRYLVMCHLQKPAKLGTRKAYATIGLSGNTGMSTGPHLHLEGWYNKMDRSKLSKTTWQKLTFDPITFL